MYNQSGAIGHKLAFAPSAQSKHDIHSYTLLDFGKIATQTDRQTDRQRQTDRRRMSE